MQVGYNTASVGFPLNRLNIESANNSQMTGIKSDWNESKPLEKIIDSQLSSRKASHRDIAHK